MIDMNREFELRAFEVDGEKVRNTLEELGAVSIGHYEYKWAIFDVQPANPDRWIRLRTDGSHTTLAVKERIAKEFDGTGEEEVGVADFDSTLRVLDALGGYTPRSVQQSRRDMYEYGKAVEVSIDTWPSLDKNIVEFEAPDEAAVRDAAQALGLLDWLTAESVEKYYLRTQGIDIKTVKNLTFAD